MGKSLTELWQRLSHIKLWPAVAMALTVGLLAYYSLLGIRYWNASRQVASLNGQIRELSAKLQKSPPEERLMAATMESAEQRLEAVRRSFSYPETDYLVAIISATAREAAVGLERVASGEGREETRDKIQYRAQPMTLMLKEKPTDIYRFLSLLQQKVPVAEVKSITISSLGGTSSVQVNLLFYLAPQAIVEKKKAD